MYGQVRLWEQRENSADDGITIPEKGSMSLGGVEPYLTLDRLEVIIELRSLQGAD